MKGFLIQKYWSRHRKTKEYTFILCIYNLNGILYRSRLVVPIVINLKFSFTVNTYIVRFIKQTNINIYITHIHEILFIILILQEL